MRQKISFIALISLFIFQLISYYAIAEELNFTFDTPISPEYFTINDSARFADDGSGVLGFNILQGGRSANAYSIFTLAGNFEASVNFGNLVFPRNQADFYVILSAEFETTTGKKIVLITRDYNYGRHKYEFWENDNAIGRPPYPATVITTPDDLSGKLRLTRVGNTFRGYFIKPSGIIEVGNGITIANATGLVKLRLHAGNAYFRPAYSGYFDNLVITAEGIIDLFNSLKPKILSINPTPARYKETVTFTGTATDPDIQITTYEWRSNIDGVFATTDSNEFQYSNLSIGEHTIYLKIQDIDGKWSEEVSAPLVIEYRPGAVIVDIKPDSPVLFKQLVTFKGSGIDPEIDIAAYQWRSSVDGVLTTTSNNEFYYDNLTPGTHTIYLRVQDFQGVWSVETSQELIVEEPTGAKADFAIEWGDISFYDSAELLTTNPAANEAVTIKARIHNIGRRDSDNNALVEFYDIYKGQENKIDYIVRASPIPAGSFTDVEIIWTGQKPEGYHIIKIIVEPTNKENDSYKFNNNATHSIVIGDPFAGDVWMDISVNLSNTNKVPCTEDPPMYDYPKVSPGERVSVFGRAEYVWEDGGVESRYPVSGAEIKVRVAGLTGEWGTVAKNGRYSRSIDPDLLIGDYWVEVSINDETISMAKKEILYVRKKEEIPMCLPDCSTGKLQVGGVLFKNRVKGEPEQVRVTISNGTVLDITEDIPVTFEIYSPYNKLVHTSDMLIKGGVHAGEAKMLIDEKIWTPMMSGNIAGKRRPHTIIVYIDKYFTLNGCSQFRQTESYSFYIYPDHYDLLPTAITNNCGSIDVRVQNVGGKDSIPEDLHIYKGKDEVCNYTLPSIPGRDQSFTVSDLMCNFSAGYYEICADVEDDITPNNNRFCKSIVVDSPDLVPFQVNVSHGYTYEPIKLIGEIDNLGCAGSTKETQVSFFVDGEDIGSAGFPVTTYRHKIEKNGRIEYNDYEYRGKTFIEKTFVDSGEYNICLKAKDQNDPNSGNNFGGCRKIMISLPTSKMPNFEIKSTDIRFNIENPKPGDPVNITAAVHNIGTAAAARFMIAFYEDGQTLIGEIQTIETEGGFQPGAGYEVIPRDINGNPVIWSSSELGDHIIDVVVSPVPPEDDPDDTNNYATRKITNWFYDVNSDISNMVSVTTLSIPPRWNDGNGIDALSLDNNGNIVAEWGGSYDPSTPITYNLYYSRFSPAVYGTSLMSVIPIELDSDYQYTLSALPPDKYYVAIRAEDSAISPNEDRNMDEREIVVPYLFSSSGLLSYGGMDIDEQNYEILNQGRTLHLQGNNWKAIEAQIKVTPYTTLEFDFLSDGEEGSINGIGLDNDLELSEGTFFQVYGTKIWGLQDFHDYETPARWTHYTIPIGSYYSGIFNYITLANNAGQSISTGVYFKDIIIYEKPDIDPPVFDGIVSVINPGTGGSLVLSWDPASDVHPPVTYNIYMGGKKKWETDNTWFVVNGLIDRTMYCFTVRAQDNLKNEDNNTHEVCGVPGINRYEYNKFNNEEIFSYGNDDAGNYELLDADHTLRLWGNSRKAKKEPVNITPYTVVEFDFRSVLEEGNINGIGFDNDLVISENTFFQIHGTDTSGIQAYHNYSPPEWKHYSIDAGTFFTGNFDYIVFANSSTADRKTNVFYRNLLIYETDDRSPPVFDGIENAMVDDKTGVVTLTWREAIDVSYPVKYNIYVTEQGEEYDFSVSSFSTGDIKYNAEGLSRGRTYCFVVRAQDRYKTGEENNQEACIYVPSGVLYTFEDHDAADMLGDHDGILINNPVFANDNDSETVVLNGLDQYIELPNDILFPAVGSDTSYQYLWQKNANGSQTVDIGWNYNMGYRFTVNKDGTISKLGGLFNGTKQVRLYDFSTGEILANAAVTSNNEWAYSDITPVIAYAGHTYVVAANIDGSGGSYRNLDTPLPQTYNNVTIECSVYMYNSQSMPTNCVSRYMYGQADMLFEEDMSIYAQGNTISIQAKIKPSVIAGANGIEVFPWQENANGSQNLDIGWNYNMGYRFTVNKDGKISKLGGLFNGTKQVRLYDFSTGEIMANAAITSDNEWAYSDITPVIAYAGHTYVVAANIDGSGASYRNMDTPLPQTYSNLTIECSVYKYNSQSMPTNCVSGYMYGQVDVGFTSTPISIIIEKPYSYSMSIEGRKLVMQLGDGNAWLDSLSTLPVSIFKDSWYTLTGIYDGYTMVIYLDGKQMAEKNNDTLFLTGNSSNVLIGTDKQKNRFFSGSMDDVYITDTVIDVDIINNDMDNDGMDDRWEVYYFGDTNRDSTGDLDNDGLSDLMEYQIGTNPDNPDTDDDRLPDGWKKDMGTDPFLNDSKADPDNDGYTNREEYMSGTDPLDTNSIPDKSEALYTFEIHDATDVLGGHDGILINSPEFISANNSETIMLNGGDQYVKLPANVLFHQNDTQVYTQHPWQENANGIQYLNMNWNYNMGYRFTAHTDGKIIRLGGLFDGTKQVRLYDFSTKEILASAAVTSNNDWAYIDIAPVEVKANNIYVVAVNISNSGGSYRSSISLLPKRYSDITIECSSYIFNSISMPSNCAANVIYGQPDIVFESEQAVYEQKKTISMQAKIKPGIVSKEEEILPWQKNANGTQYLNMNWNYNMGYRFTADTDGKITRLGGLFDGVKQVRLYDFSTKEILAEAAVTSNNEWAYTDIDAVDIIADSVYVVAAYLDGTGGAYRNVTSSFPQNYGSITIECSTYLNNSQSMPTNCETGYMYGQVDIDFISKQVLTIIQKPYSYLLAMEGDNFLMRLGDGKKWIESLRTFSLNILSDLWYTVTGIYDGNAMTIYLDGDLKAKKDNNTLTLSGNSKNVLIGTGEKRNMSFIGSMDNVSMSDFVIDIP